MVTSKARTWFRNLSKISKIGVVTGTGFAVMVAGTAFAGTPTITYKQQVVSEAVPFQITQQEDEAMLDTAAPTVITPGVNGKQNVTYQITYADAKETKREVLKRVVIRAPVTQVARIGVRSTSTVVINESIPYGSTTVRNSTMDKGTSSVTVAGVNGSKAVTYQVTTIRGQEVSRNKVSEQISTPAVTQVTSVGTKVALAPARSFSSSSCDPNYSGGCVPISSDVDCGSGSGNGPAYFYGTARVTGSDIYGLDRDGDGIACE